MLLRRFNNTFIKYYNLFEFSRRARLTDFKRLEVLGISALTTIGTFAKAVAATDCVDSVLDTASSYSRFRNLRTSTSTESGA